MSHGIAPEPLPDGDESLSPSRRPDISAAEEEVVAFSYDTLRRQTLIDADIGFDNNFNFSKNPSSHTVWYQHPATSLAQAAVIDDYGAVRRRYGGILLTSHPFSVAHRVWITAQHPVIERELDARGVSPLLLTVTALLHDHGESKLLQAYKRAKVNDEVFSFDRIAFNQSLRKLWKPGKVSIYDELEFIVEHVWWMTDELEHNGKKLSGQDRINEQIKKCFPFVRDIRFTRVGAERIPHHNPVYFRSETDTNITPEDCRITLCHQLLRFHDKIDNLEKDVSQRKRFKAFREECERTKSQMPIEIGQLRKMGLPDQDLLEAYEQALMKSYVLLFPDIPDADKEKYRKGLRYLSDEVTRLGLQPRISLDGPSAAKPQAEVVVRENDGPAGLIGRPINLKGAPSGASLK